MLLIDFKLKYLLGQLQVYNQVDDNINFFKNLFFCLTDREINKIK